MKQRSVRVAWSGNSGVWSPSSIMATAISTTTATSLGLLNLRLGIVISTIIISLVVPLVLIWLCCIVSMLLVWVCMRWPDIIGRFCCGLAVRFVRMDCKCLP